ncbi:ribbon-helix-helix protein, CopG family [Pseudotabrizicola alkalilacus]|uniref:Ribbon-helix-helix protein, CopG family n=1 Tax=Pseudotabrizicola alkalilacus TaxID=2305252 RepID=A0A411YWS7_9RHOB|nr:ribbon-helix-helix protein, CopG family [Pseudotabrizicola alkalilacus]
MGRPEVDTEPVTIRMHRDMIKQIDDYRRTLEDLPSRPEVIRRAMAEFLARLADEEG